MHIADTSESQPAAPLQPRIDPAASERGARAASVLVHVRADWGMFCSPESAMRISEIEPPLDSPSRRSPAAP